MNMSQDDEDIWQNGVKLEPDNDRGEAEDESYSPSSYIPKKVKVNREKEKEGQDKSYTEREKQGETGKENV